VSTRHACAAVYNAAALIVDNTTFEVLAYVGNSSEATDPLRGHAVDVIRRPRSTGSILKPLLYAAMLEDGTLTPHMLLPDVPTHYDGFAPENFDRQYRGAVPAEALAINIAAVLCSRPTAWRVSPTCCGPRAWARLRDER
jgi:penicillin-binding protein 1C